MIPMIPRYHDPDQAATWVGGLMGVMGLLLGGIGVYGITAYWVSQRAREVGIRIALGANRWGVIASVMSTGMKAPAIGAAIGLGIALITGRFPEAFLFGISPLDPATIAAVVGVLGGTTVLANFVPALRAARVDPARVLKEE
jgi:ABC-type antimicrobial peptide transport system permease subunit